MKFFALYNYMFEKCIDTDDIFNDKERPHIQLVNAKTLGK